MQVKKKIQKLKIVTRDKHILSEYKEGPIKKKLDINDSKIIIDDWKNSNSDLSKKVNYFLDRNNAKV